VREFKFRYVFENENGEILLIPFTIEQIEGAKDGFITQIKEQLGDEWKFKDRSMYTGYKDKNGQEFFEGDIVDLAGLMKGVISFRDGCFGVEWGKNGEQMRGLKFERFKSHGALKLLKIIGDKYRNPELLEEETK
jgi:uncharacterized phage protein (TIGR01671 family)